MSCGISKELIYEYLDGELDELSAILMREHITGCEECRAEAAQIKQLFYELDRLDKDEIEIPSEIDSIRERVYTACGVKSFSAINFIKTQKRLLKRRFSYIKRIPGYKLGTKAAKALGKGALKTSGFLLKRGMKLVFARG